MTGVVALADLIDPETATDRLRAAGHEITGAQPTYVRHKPTETTIIAYRLLTRDRTETWGYAHWCHHPDRAGEIHRKALTLRPRNSLTGPGLSRLDDHTVFYAFPNDARLRRLRWYTDSRKLKRSLEAVAGASERISGSQTTVAVLRYKPERRVVARVDLTSTTREQGLLVRYSTQRRAHLLASVATHLRDRGVQTPAPIAQLDNNHVNVDEFIDGTELRDAVKADTIEPDPLAEAIARFHATGAPQTTTARRAEHDLSGALDGLSGLSAWDTCLADPARATAELLRARLPPTSGADVLVHGDLHTKNILVSEHHVSFIDLERVAVGPAAIDLGFLNAHAIALGIRQPGWSPRAAEFASLVTDRYQTLSGTIPRSELAWHTAVGLVEQALLVARHLDTGWQLMSAQLLEAARRQLDGPVRTPATRLHHP